MLSANPMRITDAIKTEQRFEVTGGDADRACLDADDFRERPVHGLCRLLLGQPRRLPRRPQLGPQPAPLHNRAGTGLISHTAVPIPSDTRRPSPAHCCCSPALREGGRPACLQPCGSLVPLVLWELLGAPATLRNGFDVWAVRKGTYRSQLSGYEQPGRAPLGELPHGYLTYSRWHLSY